MRRTALFLSALLFVTVASAKDWYVNPETGNDQNEGTKEAPLATAQVAANRAEGGDRIILLPKEALYRQSIVFSKGQQNVEIEGNDVTLTGADPLEVEWESLPGGLSRTKLPTPLWGRQLLIVAGKAQRMNRGASLVKDYPAAEDLKVGEFRWDPIDDSEGWLTVKGSTENLEWAVRPNGFATGGDVEYVNVRNLNAKHFLNDGFNIHGNARNLTFENITGYENVDEGFSAHDTCQCWITNGKFYGNENAVADVNFADTYYENCEFADSLGVEVLFQGGRHRLFKCRITPNEESVAVRLNRGGHPKMANRISTGNVSFAETTIEGENPRVNYGPNTTVFHDADSKAWLTSSNFSKHTSSLKSEAGHVSLVYGRDDKNEPLYAHVSGTMTFEPTDALRILDFVNKDPKTNFDGTGEIVTLETQIPKAVYPPKGDAYQGPDVAAQSLWRFIHRLAPDKILLPDSEEAGWLGAALEAEGNFSVDYLKQQDGIGLLVSAPMKGPEEMRQRALRTPEEVITQLSEHYGKKFGGSYIEALALIARHRHGNGEQVPELASAFLSKSPALPKNGGDIAGTLLFAELDDEASRQRVVEVANLAFDSRTGEPLEAMPTHNEMSDAVFMGCPILAHAGRITGDKKYFDQCLTHFRFVRDKCLREDGIYRHSPLDEAAWGRGNGFPALGLALVLDVFPKDHPGHEEMLQAFQAHMTALAPYQDHTGMWHQVIDHPESYAEFTCTNMISYAALRGIRNGWLDTGEWEPRVQRALIGLKPRIGTDGETLTDVCTGTGKQKSLQDYYERKAILGKDDRGGAMALLFLSELIGWQNELAEQKAK